MAGENDVVIDAKFNAEGAGKSVDDFITGLVDGFGAIAGPVGVASAAITTFVGITIAGLEDCIKTAIELEEKWNNFDRENRVSTITSDLKEAFDDLKGSIGEGFLPGLKEALKDMVFFVDKVKEGAEAAKNLAAFFGLESNDFTDELGGIRQVISAAASSSPEQLRRQQRRQEDDEVQAIAHDIQRAAEEGIERQKALKKEAREEEKLGIENRRELEKQEQEEKRKAAEEIRNMEKELAANERFGRNQRIGKGLGGVIKEGDEFRSSIEGDANSVFNRIQSAAASRVKDPTTEAIEKFNAASMAQQTETNKFLSESVQTQKQSQKILENVGTLA